MMRASSGAKSAETKLGRLSAIYFSRRSSPAPPAGSALHAAVPQVAMTRSTEVKYNLNDERSEAIRAGHARARAAGKQIGRPRKVFRRDLVGEFRGEGLSWREIARRTGAGVGTVRRAFGRDSNLTGACQNCVADNLQSAAGPPDESNALNSDS